MKTRRLLLVTILLISIAGTVRPQSSAANAQTKAIASKRTKDMEVVLTSGSGQMKPGENDICAQFRSREPAAHVNIKDVSAGFRLLVGRIEEPPIKIQLFESGSEGYCGRIDLGPQYYKPSSYYVFLQYVDGEGKRHTIRLFLSVK